MVEATSEGHLTTQAGIEECVEALVALVCHPAIIDNSIKDHRFLHSMVEMLLKCQDLLGFGAAAALTVQHSCLQDSYMRRACLSPSGMLLSSLRLRFHDLGTLPQLPATTPATMVKCVR